MKKMTKEQLADLREARDLYEKLWRAAEKAKYIRQFDVITPKYKRYLKDEMLETIWRGYNDFVYRRHLAYQAFDNLCKLA